MSELGFDWDKDKNKENLQKHGISFEEALTAFFDEKAARYIDPDDSGDEDRFILLGMSVKLRVLIVCHCFRDGDAVIRLILARKANKRESKDYGR